MNLREWQRQASERLPNSLTPRLDAEVLISFVCRVDRAYLYANPNKLLSQAEWTQLEDLLERRQKGWPVAYLVGRQEFWSLDLMVSPDVLIPRADTETLVEMVLAAYSGDEPLKIADLGTGSGAIALALATARPHWEIVATDRSPRSLNVAKKNAERLKIDTVCFCLGDWCAALTQCDFDVIVSNPPYLSEEEWAAGMQELTFEPKNALVSNENGLEDIRKIMMGSKKHLKPQGRLMLEHGYQQGEAIRNMLHSQGYRSVITRKDLAGLERVTVASLETRN